MRSSGLSASAVPSQAAGPPMRPLRRRLSSRCTTMKPCPRDTAARAASATASSCAPAAAARAAANATKPVPIAADLESTTRRLGSRSAAVRSAARQVPDSADEMCTATTPSPPLSASACW